jgi:hypothetical protein
VKLEADAEHRGACRLKAETMPGYLQNEDEYPDGIRQDDCTPTLAVTTPSVPTPMCDSDWREDEPPEAIWYTVVQPFRASRRRHKIPNSA